MRAGVHSTRLCKEGKVMTFWQYIVTPAGPSLGPAAMLTIIVSAFVAIGDIALVVVPRELAHWFSKRSAKRSHVGRGEAGPKERELQAELRVKVGAGMALWSVALILSLLLRLLGTRGLETRLLPALVIFSLPFLVGYIIVYRLSFYRRYLEVCRRIDTHRSYAPTTKKGKDKKAVTRAPRKQRIGLMPGKALIGAAVLPITYYLVMTAFSIPPDVPVQNHDHLLHQLGMPVLALLGYLVGLEISLGSDMRESLALLKPTRK